MITVIEVMEGGGTCRKVGEGVEVVDGVGSEGGRGRQ